MSNFKKGLTFIEIVIATLIIAFGIVPIMRFAPMMLRSKSDVEEVTESAFLAKRRMDEVRGRAIDNFGISYAEGATAFPAPYNMYRYTVTDDYAVGSGAQIRTITVEVQRVGDPGSNFVLATRIASRGSYSFTGWVANMSKGVQYSQLQTAVNDGTTLTESISLLDDIRAKTNVYTENVTIDSDVEDGVRLTGGFATSDNYFENRTGIATLSGTLTITSGTNEISYFEINGDGVLIKTSNNKMKNVTIK